MTLLSIPLIVLLAVCAGCQARPELTVTAIANGEVDPPRHPFLYENLQLPLLEELRNNESLSEVADRSEGEFQSLLRLRSWVRGQWNFRDREGRSEPYPNALSILKIIRSGRLPGGMCSEYSAVFVQACLALGHQARLLSVQAANGDGHRTMEVWSNDLDKWVLMDPYFDAHFEKDGVPLNAMELHEALTSGKSGSIDLVKGERSYDYDSVEKLLPYYYHLTVIMRNNHLSLFDAMINRMSLGFKDEHTNGRPSFSQWITERGKDLYWKVNQTRLTVTSQTSDKGSVSIAVETFTPGLAYFEARRGSGPWERVMPPLAWSLGPGENVLSVRAVNVRGVAGPPASMRAEFKPASFPLSLLRLEGR